MDDILDAMEIDLEIAECGDILESHGITPTVALVFDLWNWAETMRHPNE